MNFPPKGQLLRALQQHLRMFEVRASEMPDMKVRIREGSYWDNGTNFIEFPGGISKPLTAPAVGAKIVMIGITSTGAISIIDGEASTSSPKPPMCPKNVMPCAVILLQATSTAITQEMIFDCRPVFYTRYPVSHNDLMDRNDPDAHTMESISGLQDALNARPDEEQLNQWLHTKADMIGTNSSKFIFNRAGSGVPTQDLELIFERGTTLNAILRFSKDADGALEYSNDNGTTWINLLNGGNGGECSECYTKEEIDALLDLKENVIDKKTAFNMDFGNSEGTVSEGNHNHDAIYAAISHDHDSSYSKIDHNHDSLYAAIAHNHDDKYSQLSHNHDDKYSQLSHGHDDKYSQLSHRHDDIYEPIIDKKTAFNKDFGEEEGTVAEGNHSHSSISKTIYVDGSAENESGDGSILRPFKTVKAAAEKAENGDLIRIATGTYNEEDIKFASGVSLHGETVKVILNANIVLGEADEEDHAPVSLRDITFGVKSAQKSVDINYTCEVNNCNFYGPVKFARAGKSMTVINTNYRYIGEKPSLSFEGSMYNQVLGTIKNEGEGKAIEVISGALTINNVQVSAKNAESVIDVKGTANIISAQVMNMSTGLSIDFKNSSATAANPNGLSSAVCRGSVEANTKPVIVDSVLMASGSLKGLALVFKKSSLVANDSEIEGATIKDALNNIDMDLDKLQPVVTKRLHVDMNRSDEYEADGSDLKPFKKLSDAAAKAKIGDVIIASQGIYEEDVVIPGGVSLHGESLVSIQINGSVTFGEAEASSRPISIRNVIFGKSGLEKEVKINCTCEMMGCYAYIPVSFGNASASATLFDCNFNVKSAQPAVTFTGTLFNHTVGKIINAGSGKALVMNSGMATITNGVFESSNVEETIKVGSAATMNLINSQVQNNSIEQGGIAIDLASSAGSAMRPNGLTGIVAIGNIDCGAKMTFVSGYKFINNLGSLIGTSLEFPASKIALVRPANPVNGDFWIE